MLKFKTRIGESSFRDIRRVRRPQARVTTHAGCHLAGDLYKSCARLKKGSMLNTKVNPQVLF